MASIAPFDRIFTHRSLLNAIYIFLAYFIRNRSSYIVRNTHKVNVSGTSVYNSKEFSFCGIYYETLNSSDCYNSQTIYSTLSNSEGELKSTISIGNGVSTWLLATMVQRFCFLFFFCCCVFSIYINHQSLRLWNETTVFHVKGLHLQWYKRCDFWCGIRWTNNSIFHNFYH